MNNCQFFPQAKGTNKSIHSTHTQDVDTYMQTDTLSFYLAATLLLVLMHRL